LTGSRTDRDRPRGDPSRRRQARFLAHAIQLEESGPPRRMVGLVAVIVALLGGSILWAAVTEIDQAAVAAGQVMPSGSLRLVQHLEGGIVAAISAREGDIVAAGATVIELDGAQAEAELKQLKARRAALHLKAARLRAFATDADMAADEIARRYPRVAREQQAMLAVQRQSRLDELTVLQSEIQEHEAERRAGKARQATLRQQLALVQEQLSIRSELVSKGLVSRIVYLDTYRAANSARTDLAAAAGAIEQSGEAIAVAQSRFTALDSRLRRDALNELGGVTAELAEVAETITTVQDRVRRLVITAPVRSVVKSLSVKTIGGVVAPGSVVAELVPLGEELVVETRLSTQDIGHLRPGQEAMVKVATYDFARLGGIGGTLERISASTFQDEDGAPYYKGVVRLDRNYVGSDPEKNLVLPGMTVQADIRTGRRTVLEYLLKPIYRALDSAFLER